MSEPKKYRGWCFTINNYTEDDLAAVNNLKEVCRYYCYGLEVGESGTPHIQGYVYFVNQRTMKAVSKLLKRARLANQKGTNDEAINYCMKDGDVVEWGVRPKQGERKDLEMVAKEIVEGGARAVDRLIMEDPMLFHMYGRTMDRLADVAMMNVKRNEQFRTEGIWLYGKTGTGKTYRAYRMCDGKTMYNVPDDNGWWDNYRQEEVCLLNDFRGSVKFSKLLEMCDEYNYEVNRRGRPPMPFMSKLVIVTSSLRPEEVYHNKGNDDFDQLYRRFKVYEVISKTEMVERFYTPKNDMELDE